MRIALRAQCHAITQNYNYISTQVLVNSEFTVNWSVPRAAKTDGIGMPWTLLSYKQCAVIRALYQCHLQRSFPSMAKATSPLFTISRLRQKDLRK